MRQQPLPMGCSVSTGGADPRGRLLRSAENATAEPHCASFRRWVASGERSDYADVGHRTSARSCGERHIRDVVACDPGSKAPWGDAQIVYPVSWPMSTS
jgi:hypothetical protein